jgi:transposase-like protein DUF772
MMLALLIYAYCQDVRSSWQIERRCLTDVAFRVLCAQDVPDHATIARFRAEHEAAFAALFTQVLQVAATAGLVRLGTVAVDGTKIPANASIDAKRGQEWLDEQVRQIIAEARGADAEDAAAAAGRATAPTTRTVTGCPRGCGIAVTGPSGSAGPPGGGRADDAARAFAAGP